MRTWIGRLLRLQGSARVYPGCAESVIADRRQGDQEGGGAGNGEYPPGKADMVVHGGQQLLHGHDAQRYCNNTTERNGLEEFAAKHQPEAAIRGAKDFTDADFLLPSFHDETGKAEETHTGDKDGDTAEGINQLLNTEGADKFLLIRFFGEMEAKGIVRVKVLRNFFDAGETIPPLPVISEPHQEMAKAVFGQVDDQGRRGAGGPCCHTA